MTAARPFTGINSIIALPGMASLMIAPIMTLIYYIILTAIMRAQASTIPFFPTVSRSGEETPNNLNLPATYLTNRSKLIPATRQATHEMIKTIMDIFYMLIVQATTLETSIIIITPIIIIASLIGMQKQHIGSLGL